jgi:sulfatase maturation enzyme AslB (radical SAM superfamily)
MVPKISTEQMSPEIFRKMCEITDKVLEKGDYDKAIFRLSGGEPFTAFKNYKDIVTGYTHKSKGKISFGVLTNATIINEENIDWLLENRIGIHVSLDDLENSKPLTNGESSAKTTRKNIDWFLKKQRLCCMEMILMYIGALGFTTWYLKIQTLYALLELMFLHLELILKCGLVNL